MAKKNTRNHSLHHELCHFFCFGLFTTSIDFLVYSIAQHFIPYSIAKTISFLTGSCFSYILNKRFTFQQKHHKATNMFRFAVVYLSSMCMNVLVNSTSIAILTHMIYFTWLTHTEIIIISFLAATGVSTFINFTGQKFWVFKNSERLDNI